MRSLLPNNIAPEIVDIWQQDESRFGQQGSSSRIWSPIGLRIRKVKQKQFISTYIFGAACAKTGQSFGLILPSVNTENMQLYLDMLSKEIEEGRHAALVVDNAGWHTAKDLKIPSNITLIPLPPYSPELNAIEQVWEWIKKHHLSHCVFKNYKEICDKVSEAWKEFSDDIDLVKTICYREWQQIRT